MKKTVLLVDDSMFMREILKNILSNNEYNIIGEASNGFEAIEKYKELNPDILSLDIVMPQMNGIDTLKEIIKFDNYANIIMCSAMGQNPMIMESIKSGAKDFIVKPFTSDQIIEVFKRIN